jgi:hypothetical protein
MCEQCDKRFAGTVSPRGGEAVRESLASYAHQAWSGWMRYMFSRGQMNQDGSFTIPPVQVERWQRQMNTAYADLPESEKASGREEADRILRIVEEKPNGSGCGA